MGQMIEFCGVKVSAAQFDALKAFRASRTIPRGNTGASLFRRGFLYITPSLKQEAVGFSDLDLAQAFPYHVHISEFGSLLCELQNGVSADIELPKALCGWGLIRVFNHYLCYGNLTEAITVPLIARGLGFTARAAQVSQVISEKAIYRIFIYPSGR